MPIGDSDRLQQVLVRAEPAYANLGTALNGTPNASGLHTPLNEPASGVCVANPEFTSQYEVAENETVRNRPFRHTPTGLTRAAEVSVDVYMRGNGNGNDANVFTDNTFTLLDACFGIKSTHSVEHDVSAFGSATQVSIVDAYEGGLRPGMGFHIVLPSGKSFISFVTTVVDNAQGNADIVSFSPPLSSAELTQCQGALAAGDAIKLRGGRTYAVGDEYRDASSLYFMLLKQAYGQEVFGARGTTVSCNMEVGQPGVLSLGFNGTFTHEGGYAPALAVTSWETTDSCTMASVTGLVVGMYAKVTTTEAPAGSYIVRILSITGAGPYVVKFEPTGLPAGIDNENPVPGLGVVAPGATSQPAGKWLKMLNGRVSMDGVDKHVRSVSWNLDMNAVAVPTPNNMAGAVDMVMGEPTITAEVVLSAYDDGVQFQKFTGEETFSLLCMMGAGEAGEAAAFYCPKMFNNTAPDTGEVDNLTSLNLNMSPGLVTTDGDAYDGVGPSNTVCRLFFAW